MLDRRGKLIEQCFITRSLKNSIYFIFGYVFLILELFNQSKRLKIDAKYWNAFRNIMSCNFIRISWQTAYICHTTSMMSLLQAGIIFLIYLEMFSSHDLKFLAPSSIYNYILFLIIMKAKGPEVFKLVKANSALDFLNFW